MTLDTNPVPIKTALSLCGHCTADLRLPLAPLSSAKTEQLRATLADYDLL